jgi:hypothetical protein
MSHFVVMRGAEKLVAEAQALHPTDKVQQCVHIIGRRGSWTDAYAEAQRDVAFDRVFRFLSDEEVAVWANYCLHEDVPAMARGRMWRAANATTMERAA